MTIAQYSDKINNKTSPTNKSQATLLIKETVDRIKREFRRYDLDEIAYEVGFFQRSSAKIRGFDFLVSLLVSSLDPAHTSLEKISEIFSRVNRSLHVSSQAIMQKINSKGAVQFVETVFYSFLNNKMSYLNENLGPSLNFFSKVLIQDSTVIQLNEKLQKHFKGSGGRASSATAKLDVVYDYKAKNFERIKLTDQGKADQQLSLEIEGLITENTLIIRDLGYLNLKSLKQIYSKNAFFLSRLRSDLKVFLRQEDDEETDLVDYMNKHGNNGMIDVQVFITKQKLPVRLVAIIAPEEVSNKRRRAANATATKQGRTLNDKTLKLMNLTIFITNVPQGIWKAEVIFKIYGVRWQIELIFKCWKSRIQISYLSGINPERIRCLIYARLILALIINQIYKLVDYISINLLEREVSMPKVFEWIRDTDRLIKIIKGLLSTWEIRNLLETISRSMCTQTRNRKTTLENMLEVKIIPKKGS